jgi:flavin reductase (DIM6/NTAB) family NADH-FMN oxidoreductase RutF
MTINSCQADMVSNVAQTAGEYAANISEFTEANLSTLASTVVRPARVAESKVQMEAIVHKMIQVGDGAAGSSTLIIAEILKFHISSDLYQNGRVRHDLLNCLARLGAADYAELGKITRYPTPKVT